MQDHAQNNRHVIARNRILYVLFRNYETVDAI